MEKQRSLDGAIGSKSYRDLTAFFTWQQLKDMNDSVHLWNNPRILQILITMLHDFFQGWTGTCVIFWTQMPKPS